MRDARALFAVLTLLSSLCLAQDGSTGSIRGVVLDPSGRRIVGATIALVNNSTSFHYQQTSDVEGRFAFGMLPPGDYSARVTADKMAPQLRPSLLVALRGGAETDSQH